MSTENNLDQFKEKYPSLGQMLENLTNTSTTENDDSDSLDEFEKEMAYLENKLMEAAQKGEENAESNDIVHIANCVRSAAFIRDNFKNYHDEMDVQKSMYYLLDIIYAFYQASEYIFQTEDYRFEFISDLYTTAMYLIEMSKTMVAYSFALKTRNQIAAVLEVFGIEETDASMAELINIRKNLIAMLKL